MENEAYARSRAYAFLADLTRRGLCSANLGEARAWPELEDVLGAVDAAGLEDHAVRHERVLSRDVFPFEGVFIDVSAQPGGGVTARVIDAYAAIGFDWDPTGPGPDHVSVQLAAMSFLSGAESDAELDGRSDEVERMRGLQRDLLGRHLMVWLPALSEAVQSDGDPFFARVAQLIDALVGHHASDVGAEAVAPVEAGDDASLTALLEHEATGIAQIARYLLTPVRCGVFWSASRLRAVGRRHRVPGGFGSRVQRLETLIQTAARHDLGPAVVRDLEAELVSAASFHRRYAESGPSLAVSADRWRDRIERTARGLEVMVTRAGETGA